MIKSCAAIVIAAKHGELIKVKDASGIAYTVGTLRCKFDFRTTDWNYTTRTAVFCKGNVSLNPKAVDTAIGVTLDGVDECAVPPEVLLPDEKYFSVGVWGVTGDGLRIVSEWLVFRIKDGCYVDSAESFLPTPSVYEQILMSLSLKAPIDHKHEEYLTESDLASKDYATETFVEDIVNESMKGIPSSLSDLKDDTTHRTVTDVEKQTWNNKVDKVAGKGLSTNDYTNAEKEKLAKLSTDSEANMKQYVDTKFAEAKLDQYTTEQEVKAQIEGYRYATTDYADVAAASAQSAAIADAASKYEAKGTAQGIVNGLNLSTTYEPIGAENRAIAAAKTETEKQVKALADIVYTQEEVDAVIEPIQKDIEELENAIASGGGSSPTAGKEVVIVDIQTMLATQDVAQFLEISQKIKDGETVVYGRIGDAIGMITGYEEVGGHKTWNALVLTRDSYNGVDILNTYRILCYGDETLDVDGTVFNPSQCIMKSEDPNILYGTKDNGLQMRKTYSQTADANTIAERTSIGTLQAANPQEDGDVATKKYVDDVLGSGSNEKEVVFCDIGKMLQDQDVPKFLELSQRFEKGECIIAGYLDGQMAIVTGLYNQGDNNIHWTITSYGEDHSDDATPVFVGAFVKCVNGEYLDFSMKEVAFKFVTENYVNSLPENITLTDGEQAQWRNWMGAAAKLNPDANGRDSLWTATNEQGTWRYIQVNAYTATPWYIPVYMPESIGDSTNGGYMLTETPTRAYHAANKKYVDDNFVSKSNEYPGYNVIYARGGDNEPKVYIPQYIPNYGNLALWSSPSAGENDVGVNGTLVCPIPTQPYQTANKKYVEDNFVPRYTGSKGRMLVYGRDGELNETVLTVSNTASANNLVRWTPNTSGDEDWGGNASIILPDPTRPYQAANKKYVDEKVAAAGGGGTQLYKHIFTFYDEDEDVDLSAVFYSTKADKYNVKEFERLNTEAIFAWIHCDDYWYQGAIVRFEFCEYDEEVELEDYTDVVTMRELYIKYATDMGLSSKTITDIHKQQYHVEKV